MIGRLVLCVRQKFGHGLRVAYFRDFVRSQILTTAAVEGLTDGCCEIHVFTSQQDWLNLVWALKSFYWASGRRYKLCIHEDGTLDATARREITQHFPDARIIDRDRADNNVLPTLAGFPRCLEFRRTNHLSPKLFDFWNYLDAERMLLLDSDVLFFDEPKELLRRIEDPAYRFNSVNADVTTAYTVNQADVTSAFGFELPDKFNSGLGLIHRDSLRVDWIEEFLGLPGILGHFWRIEQTLFALCSARFGVELLPAEYRISLEPGIAGCVAKHYVGAVRHLMYSEGMAKLKQSGLLQSKGLI